MGAKAGTPRVDPGGRGEIGLLNWLVVRVIAAVTGGPAPHVFTTLARNRGLFRRWMVFAGGLMPGGKLARAETELVILRVAHNCDCDYEWGQHETIAQAAGISADEVQRVRQGPDADGWSERQADLLRAADELHRDRVIGDALWSRLAGRYSEAELIELCMLVGHYEMLAGTLRSLGVQPDRKPMESGRGLLARLVWRVVARRGAS